MIITVTLNPAIDKTATVDGFKVNEINRIYDIVHDSGGKGINVSKTILSLGGNSIATGFIGGYFGMMVERDLVDLGITVNFVHIDAETRTNTKILDINGGVTEFNEPGPSVTEFEIKRLTDKLVNMANEDSIIVLSGSLPSGVEPAIYRDLIYALHKKGAKVYTDCDGDAFKFALEATPDLLKPNKSEVLNYFGKADATEEELIDMGKYFINKGISYVIISCGAEGAYFFTKDKIYKSPAVEVEVRSTVGAGDTMMAVFAYYSERGYSFEDAIKMSVAASAASITTKGTRPAPIEVVNDLLKYVVVEEI